MIKANDLVMIVRPECDCAGGGSLIGAIGIVTSTELWHLGVHCGYCKKDMGVIPTAYISGVDGGNPIAQFALKKIDPPALPETINEKLEITA